MRWRRRRPGGWGDSGPGQRLLNGQNGIWSIRSCRSERIDSDFYRSK
jgi:hypothetical protein